MQAPRGNKSNPFSESERAEIASRLALVRRSMCQGRGLLQAEMAQVLGVSHSHYSKCETGHNSFSARFVKRFAECTGVSADWLEHGRGDMYLPKSEVPVPAAEEPVAARTKEPMEALVLRVLAAARDSQVVAAAEALAQATDASYEESLAMVIARRLAIRAPQAEAQPATSRAAIE